MADQLSPMDEQTALDSTIKIRCPTTTDARNQLIQQARILSDDGETPVATRAVSPERQKTNIVIKTREEAESLIRVIGYTTPRSNNTRRALERVEKEVLSQLKRQGMKDGSDSDYRSDFELVEMEGTRGQAPDDPPFEPGDIVRVKGFQIGFLTCEDGEQVPSEDLFDVVVEKLGPEKVLINYDSLKWIPYDAIEGVNMEKMERRDIQKSVRGKRESADWDALAELCQRHCEQVAAEVWPSGTVPVDEIEFRFNPKFSWLGGQYHRRYSPKGPMIELSKELYVSRGLDYLLSVARHELIHAWQDYHENGHPDDTHDHHGRDFKQWVDDLDTHQYCCY